MSGIFSKTTLSGNSLGLGDLWDDITSVIPTGDGGGGGGLFDQPPDQTPPKQSPGAIPKLDQCVYPYMDDPLNPTQFCVLDPKVNTTCPAGQYYDVWAKKCIVKGGADDVGGGEIGPMTGQPPVDPTKMYCPYGQKYDATQKKCVSTGVYIPPPTGGVPKTGGGTTGGTKTGGTTPVKPGVTLAGMLSNPLVWMGILIVGGGVAVVVAKKQKAAKAAGRI